MVDEKTRARKKAYYEANRDRLLPQIRASKKRQAEKVRAFVIDYLQTNSCIDCGFDNILALEFHHRDPTEKTKDVSQMIARSYSLPSVRREIEKCDILCANCHRIRTAHAQGFYKTK